jgi:hypothetical protein
MQSFNGSELWGVHCINLYQISQTCDESLSLLTRAFCYEEIGVRLGKKNP